MKIIDAHLHLFSHDEGEEMARQVGHHNSTEHLRQVYGELGIVHGVVMGNHSLDPAYHDYPADLFHYCVGLDSSLLADGGRVIADLPDRVEENLRRESCCGTPPVPCATTRATWPRSCALWEARPGACASVPL